jgi:hypothetical protein
MVGPPVQGTYTNVKMAPCPLHQLLRHACTPVADAFMCRECKSLFLARCASGPPLILDIPEKRHKRPGYEDHLSGH